MILIDFETRSALDVGEVGAWRYSRSPTTSVMCLAYKIDDGEIQLWEPLRLNTDPPRDLVRALRDPKQLIEAHNYFFEYSIYHNVLVTRAPRFFAPIPIERFTCTSARSAFSSMPRKLEHVAAVLKLSEQKDKEGHRLMLQLSKPTAMGTFDENPEKLERVGNYCIQDIRTEHALSLKIPEIKGYEAPIFTLDQKINLRGVPLNIELIEALIERADLFMEGIQKRISDLTDGEITSTGQIARILEWVNRKHDGDTPAIESLGAKVIESYLRQYKDKLPEKTVKILECRQAGARTSTKKLLSMKKCVDLRDRRARGLLVYYGAHTGRYSAQLIQPHNIPRGTLKDEELKRGIKIAMEESPEFFLETYKDKTLEAISSLIRPCIAINRPGLKLMAGDFSAIEPRTLFWLAGEEIGLAIYHGDGMLYEEMASDVYHVPKEKVNKDQRQFGKVVILSCGYGMGVDKFIQSCENYNIFNVPKSFAKMTIDIYRKKFKKVVEFWYAIEKACFQALDAPRAVFTVGRLSISYRGGILYIRLPSGRSLKYNGFNCGIKETKWGPRKSLHYWGVDSETKKWGKIHTYGPKLVENLIQAVARDFMAEAMLRLEEAGFPIILTVHDEIVCEVPVKKDLSEFERIMSLSPEWGKGCPVAVEAWEGQFYKK